jgi:hypothetical protein
MKRAALRSACDGSERRRGIGSDPLCPKGRENPLIPRASRGPSNALDVDATCL